MKRYSLSGIYNKAMVTGGAGFIGSHLVESLLADGLEVISIDDYSAGKTENLSELHRKYGGNLQEVNCDVTDYDKLKTYFDGVDVVFHQACSKMTVCLKDPRRDLQINAGGTFNMLELARDHNVKKFVHVSTGSVFGKAQYYPTDEKHPLNPSSYYGVSKLAGEKYVRAFKDLYDMNVSILRYYHVYGPRQESSDVGGVVSIFARRALENKDLTIYGDGSQIRSFTYVQDVVDINKFVAITEEARGEDFNCASGLSVSIKELAESVLHELDKKELAIEYKDWKIGDIKDFDVSHDKLVNMGFKFQYLDFPEGLTKTLNWSKNHFSDKKG
ncbi:SDR family NAD(P)-dependent oxidoreductase [Vibrio sp. VB16]|uniref:SDR family NAD(P)-dependent oxidoreductase n=1 Tax=Vibrio sp. VB16 TaxID=2785746 RepID=UPI0018A0EFE3|nr:SDR family NAD(P)-dependent oxidoreductase [Vibrio sp. VB16]UGA54988.1 SDR family NAD(P)-dependent oxidoreductase [Vibrio sp. VB16]